MGDDSQFAHIPGDRDRWELDLRPADVLLIGSQLAYGSVGTNASAPVLTGSGLRVSLVPTILLSNLPHHRRVHSVAIPPEWLGQVLSDLAALTVTDEIDTVSTGYFADPQQVEVVAGFLAGLVQRRPQLRVVVDPTLGDDDVGAYTDPRVAASLREHLLPLATGLTPNRYELEQLTGTARSDDTTEQQIADQARSLLGARGSWAVVTGGAVGAEGSAHGRSTDLVVTADGYHALTHDRAPGSAKGTGDVFTAALVSSLHAGHPTVEAAKLAAAVVRDHVERRSL